MIYVALCARYNIDMAMQQLGPCCFYFVVIIIINFYVICIILFQNVSVLHVFFYV